MKNVFETRTLWFDGTSEVSPERVPELLLSGVPLEKIAVTEVNADILKFNQFSEIEINSNKKDNAPFDLSWNIPEEYSQIDISEFLLDSLWAFIDKKQMPLEQSEIYAERLQHEIEQIKSRNLESLIKALIYVIATFKESNTIWGVGRGSSCASLALFLIGVHSIDPVKYDIDASEFFKS